MVGTARTAAEQVADILTQIQEKVVQAETTPTVADSPRSRTRSTR